MPILWTDMERLADEIREDLGRIRHLRDDAYRLALLGLKSPRYETEAEFKAAVDAVLAHFNLQKGPL